jgi:hypothetical protein
MVNPVFSDTAVRTLIRGTRSHSRSTKFPFTSTLRGEAWAGVDERMHCTKANKQKKHNTMRDFSKLIIDDIAVFSAFNEYPDRVPAALRLPAFRVTLLK